MTEGVVVALIGLAGAVIASVIQSVVQTRSQYKAINRRLDKIEKHNKEQYLGILRLTVVSEEIPTSERIIAGKQYIDEGGNGDVKKFYENFVKQHTK